MNNVIDEPTVQKDAESKDYTCYTDAVQDAARRLQRSVNEAKAAAAEKIGDGKFAAERLLRQGRYAVEDSIDIATRKIRRHPFQSLALGFAAGAALALLLPRFNKR